MIDDVLAECLVPAIAGADRVLITIKLSRRMWLTSAPCWAVRQLSPLFQESASHYELQLFFILSHPDALMNTYKLNVTAIRIVL